MNTGFTRDIIRSEILRLEQYKTTLQADAMHMEGEVDQLNSLIDLRSNLQTLQQITDEPHQIHDRLRIISTSLNRTITSQSSELAVLKEKQTAVSSSITSAEAEVHQSILEGVGLRNDAQLMVLQDNQVQVRGELGSLTMAKDNVKVRVEKLQVGSRYVIGGVALLGLVNGGLQWDHTSLTVENHGLVKDNAKLKAKRDAVEDELNSSRQSGMV